MRCPTLAVLPTPSKNKNGWPWTEEIPQLADTMPDGSPWPKISIVTPSYNQGCFIEETIRSVLLQGYPELEYMVFDGGSDDGSAEIIRKYSPWLTYWVSEPDRGQSNAINKGFKLSTGEIIGWINADDIYLPNAFEQVSQYFNQKKQDEMVYGICCLIDENSTSIGAPIIPPSFNKERLIKQDDYIPQPSTFFRRRALEKVGGVNEALKYSMDYELWVKIGLCCNVGNINTALSCFRRQPKQKTYQTNPTQYRENLWIRAKYGGIKQKYQYIRHLFAERILQLTQ